MQVWQFSHDCRSSVVLCNAPLRSFVGPLRSFAVLCGPLWSFAVLCGPLRYLVIPQLLRETEGRERRGGVTEREAEGIPPAPKVKVSIE